MSCGIYKITNKVNGKVYVGQSVDIEARWNAEKWHGKSASSNSQAVIRAFRKYGLNSFNFEIIEEVSTDQLDVREKYWIDFFDAYNPSKGYNETFGGQNGHGGVKRPPETGQRISAALKGKSRPSMQGRSSGMAGKTHSEETRQKISEALKKRPPSLHGPMSEENKQKIRNGWTETARLAAAERARNQPKTTGWHHSEDAKQKMSKAKKGKLASNKDVPRTEARKINDRIIALKRHLAKEKPCLRFTNMARDVRYFVSEFETAIQLTGKFGQAALIARMTDNPQYLPVKKLSLGWRTFQGCHFEACPQEELLEHRPELK